MKKTRFSIDQIIRILAEAETPGNSVASVARKYGIVEQTIYRWRQKYKGFSASEAKRLKLYFDTFLRGGELYLANALRLLVKRIIENHFPLHRWKKFPYLAPILDYP